MYKDRSIYQEVNVKSKNSTKNFTSGTKVYRGISTANPENTNIVLYDIALIKQDIINHFHIRQGECLSDLQFGTIVWDVLFEPVTPTLRNLIIENVNDIINSDPRVSVSSVVIDEYESGIQIECNLVYLPYNIQESMQLNFDRNVGFLAN